MPTAGGHLSPRFLKPIFVGGALAPGTESLSISIIPCLRIGYGDSIVVAGENYGQGSSREHAAIATVI
ncbi:MAG: hypothetical protein ACYDG4_06130 [Desulfuromonadaceae bacterium]